MSLRWWLLEAASAAVLLSMVAVPAYAVRRRFLWPRGMWHRTATFLTVFLALHLIATVLLFSR